MVVSKLDQLAPSSDKEAVNAALTMVEDRFKRERARGSWEVFGIASSPEVNTSFAVRFGVSELFGSWLSDPVQSEVRNQRVRVAAGGIASLGPAWAPERYIHE